MVHLHHANKRFVFKRMVFQVTSSFFMESLVWWYIWFYLIMVFNMVLRCTSVYGTVLLCVFSPVSRDFSLRVTALY